MLCLPELLCDLLPGEKHGVAGGGHNGVVGAHAAVGVVGRDHLLQNVDDLVAVVQGRVLEPLQVGVEFFQIDLHGRRDEDFVVGGFGHLVLLGVHEQFLVQLFAGAQTGDLDLHIYAWLVAVEAYQAVGQIHDLNRLAHVQHVDATALRQTAGLQNELRSLGDGHK
mgnify:FL=1